MISESIYVRNTYEKIAHEFSNTRYHIWDFVKFFMEDKGNLYGVDIGCGNGKNMMYSNIIGIDNCKGFVNICKSKNKQVVLGDICNLPFKNKTFDYAISIAALHHLSTNDRRNKCLDEMIRVMKKDAEGLISVWSKEYQTKHNFDLGDNYVPWKSRNEKIETEYRYYYVMDYSMFFKFINQFEKRIDVLNLKNEKGNWILHFKKL